MALFRGDAELIETWATHGMPENDSTRAHAVKLLVGLLDENRELRATIVELTDLEASDGE